MNDQLRNKLISNGVKNIREFGYPNVNTDNILTDEVYSAFFKSMLRDNKGHNKQVDAVIDVLLSEIK